MAEWSSARRGDRALDGRFAARSLTAPSGHKLAPRFRLLTPRAGRDAPPILPRLSFRSTLRACSARADGTGTRKRRPRAGSPAFTFIPASTGKIRPTLTLTDLDLREIFPNLRFVDRGIYLAPLNAALVEFHLDEPKRCAAFLAQIGHESLGLSLWTELWGPTDAQKRYEGRADLGNVRPGDGYRFRGRCPVMLTGRANYASAGLFLGVPLTEQPDLANLPQHGFRIAGWFWRTRGLAVLSDRDTLAAYRLMTQRLNGGMNGWADRFARWTRARNVLGLPALEA